MNLEELKNINEAPHWYSEEAFTTVTKGYLQDEETPRGMYQRVARTAAMVLNKPELELRLFEAMWNNWICPASPILANFGTNRGLPISCNSLSVADSLDNILQKNHELGMLAKHGAGVGIGLSNLRARGTKVNGTGGISDGVIAWSKIYDATIHSTSQGNTRRGSAVVNLDINHLDIEEFLQMRRPTGDLNKRCLNLNHCIVIDDKFMQSLLDGNQKNRLLWQQILQTRIETGEPYLLFKDTVNKNNPDTYKSRDLLVTLSNLCIEIMLYADPDHTFVCCLLSMNLFRFEEWENTDVVELAVYLLDAVLTEYIDKAKGIPGFESAVRFAEKSRAIGIGGLGWHSLLQAKMLPFDSFGAMMLNSKIWRTIKTKAEEATTKLAVEFGEPEWCVGFNRRHTHLMAVAPTVTNSIISGNMSAGIEPWAANIFVQQSAKGTFIRKNKELEKLLESKNMNTDLVWNQINKDAGSVQSLDCLSLEEKEVFLTAREINQFAIIKQASQRQKYIDQGQSVNLFFASNSDPKYIHNVHLSAWQEGLKSLYYCRSESVIRADLANRNKDECAACEA